MASLTSNTLDHAYTLAELRWFPLFAQSSIQIITLAQQTQKLSSSVLMNSIPQVLKLISQRIDRPRSRSEFDLIEIDNNDDNLYTRYFHTELSLLPISRSNIPIILPLQSNMRNQRQRRSHKQIPYNPTNNFETSLKY